MLNVVEKALALSVLDQLTAYQRVVDSAGEYKDRVSEAKRCFPIHNRSTNKTFRVVRENLSEMCNGARRCMYCEDSVADEVEHFRPKDLYPELVFAWSNFLYACGPCNGPKNNRFAVIDDTGSLVDVSRSRSMPIVEPVAGLIALIDPRRENPLDFLMLDIRDTFEFTSIADDGSAEDLRANYTIEVLRLNQRDYLVEARENALGGYVARLQQYISARNDNVSIERLKLLQQGIQTAPHPTVWAEMVRQKGHHPSIDELFAAAPEAVHF